jgi:carbon monoxide dehydrogenase subunit G
MKPVTVSATIAADPDRVYEAIVDIERLTETSPATLSVTFLSEKRSGPGTRYRETRRMGKTSRDFDLELAECDAQRRTARFISEMEGTVWDTTMKVLPSGGGSYVEFTMAAQTTSKLKSLLFSGMRPMFRKGMTRQVEGLKTYCERA